MDDDLFSRPSQAQLGRHRDNLFGWTIFILLLIAFAFACWIGSFYLFGHPENPRSYAILKKIKKIEPPKRFELTTHPIGEYLTPKQVYERYIAMSRLELQRENQQLLRDYINNYQNTKKLVPYVTGRYSVLQATGLQKNDLFDSGIVAFAYAIDFPHLLIEHVYTTDDANMAPLRQMLVKGLEIKLERTLDLSAVIHVEKLEDGKIQLTVVPLLYGSYALRQGTGSFSLQPPVGLNLTGGMPILKPDRTTVALKSVPPDAEPGPKTKAAPASTIVRVEPVATPIPLNASAVRPGPQTPATGVASPTAPSPQPAPPEPLRPTVAAAVPVAVPVASASAIAVQAPVTTPTPVTAAQPVSPKIAAAIPVGSPFPKASPAVAMATPTPAPVSTPAAAAPMPLQPFLAAAPTPNLTTNAPSSWRTFSPGQMPRGRLIAPDELGEFSSGLSGERVYLRGRFDVTVSGETRAVLRPQGNALSNLVRSGETPRIIVEYPAGTPPPGAGSVVSRDQLRPFQIIDVRRDSGGQVNVYVREITSQE